MKNELTKNVHSGQVSPPDVKHLLADSLPLDSDNAWGHTFCIS